LLASAQQVDREESNNCLAISSLDKTNQQFHDEEKKHERCQMLCVVEELLSFFPLLGFCCFIIEKVTIDIKCNVDRKLEYV